MATPGGGTRRAALTSLAVAAAVLLVFVAICTIPAERVESLLRSDAQVPQNGRFMTTPWTVDVDPRSPLPDYPRPQLQRQQWLNLNGIWQFEAGGLGDPAPDLTGDLERRIVVPFPVESALSGVFRHDSGHTSMYYKRNFTIPAEWGKQHVLLHFGAVDWAATVSVDGVKVLTHHGGYDKFSVDITEQVSVDLEGQHELTVEVFDPTEFAHIPLGKQRLHPARHPSSIFYVSNSGIWQTVWLEPVPKAHIERVDAIPDIDAGLVTITVRGNQAAQGLNTWYAFAGNRDGRPADKAVPPPTSPAASTMMVSVTATSRQGNSTGSGQGTVNQPFNVTIPDAQWWSPDFPNLYDLDVKLLPGTNAAGKQVSVSNMSPRNPAQPLFADQMLPAAATAARHQQDALLMASNSTARQLLLAALHNRSAPSAEATARALAEEGVRASQLVGLQAEAADAVRAYFGMRKISLGVVGDETNLRPLLNNKFVFHMGMLDQGFWPDGIYVAPTDEALKSDIVVSKQMGYNMLRKHIKVERDRWYYWADTLGILVWQDAPCLFWEWGSSPNPTDAERRQYEREMERMVVEHYSHPSIVIYVVFNEGWGQYETQRVTLYAKSLDASRLFDCASGWFDADVGDLHDMHMYVGPGSPNPTGSRAAVLGEFGGLGHRVADHQWIPEDSFSYEMEETLPQLQTRYEGLVEQLVALMVAGDFSLSAAVYTELTDVEAEINGQLTYDRRVVKVNIKDTYNAHQALYNTSELINKGKAVLNERQLHLALKSMAEAPKSAHRHAVGSPSKPWADPSAPPRSATLGQWWQRQIVNPFRQAANCGFANFMKKWQGQRRDVGSL